MEVSDNITVRGFVATEPETSTTPGGVATASLGAQAQPIGATIAPRTVGWTGTPTGSPSRATGNWQETSAAASRRASGSSSWDGFWVGSWENDGRIYHVAEIAAESVSHDLVGSGNFIRTAADDFPELRADPVRLRPSRTETVMKATRMTRPATGTATTTAMGSRSRFHQRRRRRGRSTRRGDGGAQRSSRLSRHEPWQNCRVKRARTMNHRTALARVRFGVLAVAMVSAAAVACSAPGSSSARGGASSAAVAHATAPASPGASLDAAAPEPGHVGREGPAGRRLQHPARRRPEAGRGADPLCPDSGEIRLRRRGSHGEPDPHGPGGGRRRGGRHRGP